jgi:hypothetical protein
VSGNVTCRILTPLFGDISVTVPISPNAPIIFIPPMIYFYFKEFSSLFAFSVNLKIKI